MKIHGQPHPTCFWFAALAAILPLLAGCAHAPRTDESVARGMIQLQIPRLLVSPAAALLGNAEGYNAEVQSGSTGVPEFSAQLFCRQNKLLLIPAANPASRRGIKNGVSFIWDASEDSGYVLCDALQGYARISSPRHYSASPVAADAAAQSESIDGHDCLREQVTVMADDGTISQLDAWRAPELKSVRVKIVSTGAPAPTTVMLSKISLELPPAEMFAPPSDFTAYPSLEAMQDELNRRAQTLRGPSREPTEMPPNYGDPRAYHPPSSGGY